MVTSPNSRSAALTTADSDGSFVTELVAPPGSWIIVKHDPTPSQRWLPPDLATAASPDGLLPGLGNTFALMPGSWGMVPFEPKLSGGAPFAISSATKEGRLDYNLSGSMNGDFRPGGSVTLAGIATVYATGSEIGSLIPS